MSIQSTKKMKIYLNSGFSIVHVRLQIDVGKYSINQSVNSIAPSGFSAVRVRLLRDVKKYSINKSLSLPPSW